MHGTRPFTRHNWHHEPRPDAAGQLRPWPHAARSPLWFGLRFLGASWFCPCPGGGSSDSAGHHPKSEAIPRRTARPAACRRRRRRLRPGATQASRGPAAHLPRPPAPPHCPTPTRPPRPDRQQRLRARRIRVSPGERGACARRRAAYSGMDREHLDHAAAAPWFAASPPAPVPPCVGRSGTAFSGPGSCTTRSLAEEAPQPIAHQLLTASLPCVNSNQLGSWFCHTTMILVLRVYTSRSCTQQYHGAGTGTGEGP